MCVLFAACFAIVLLTDGGVYPLSQSLATMIMAMVLAAAATLRPWPQGRAWPLVSCMILWGVLVLWVLLQTIPLPGGILSNPAWSVLRQNIGVPAPMAQGRISVVPDDTRFSLLPISLPFLTFMAALLLFPADRHAMLAWRAIALIGGLLAIVAIVQAVLFPDMLMFARKEAYLGSLTAPFVNRNTAATFYGVLALVQLSEAVLALRVQRAGGAPYDGRRNGGASSSAYAAENGAMRGSASRLLALFTGRSDDALPPPAHRAVLFAALALSSLVALALTQSRGGALAVFAGLAVFVVATAMDTATAGGRAGGRAGAAGWGRANAGAGRGGRRRGPAFGRSERPLFRAWLFRHPLLCGLLAFVALALVAAFILGRAFCAQNGRQRMKAGSAFSAALSMRSAPTGCRASGPARSAIPSQPTGPRDAISQGSGFVPIMSIWTRCWALARRPPFWSPSPCSRCWP